MEGDRKAPSTPRAVALGLRLGLLLAGGTLGLVLLTDRPGLTTEYFALGEPWQGRPFHTSVALPELESVAGVSDVLATDVVFSIRWRGWWHVPRAGAHRFALTADDGGYVLLDGEVVADTHGVFGAPVPGAEKTLAAGFHELEIGLYQVLGPSRLEVRWAPPGSAAAAAGGLPATDLYAGRPLALRRALRRLAGPLSRPWRQLLGAALLIATAFVLRGSGRLLGPLPARLRARRSGRWPGAGRVLLPLALFAIAFVAVLPYTGTIRGGDDTAYLEAAAFAKAEWFFHRYAHIYLLKLFIALAGGDPFLATRLWWSFVFAGTLALLAVAVRTVGPGLQLGTLAATLFVLLSQTTLFGLVGSAFADYGAMLFVTAAVTVYLHGPARERGDPPPRREWHAFAIGALTLAAMRSKEVGAVLLLLPLLLLLVDGRPSPRRWLRRLLWWAAGAAVVLGVLVLLDGIVLGNPLFSFDPERAAATRKMNFPARMAPRPDSDSWLALLWEPWGHAAGRSLRYLWIGVAAAAAGATMARRRLELRLLHLLPIAYVVALVALYTRMPHPFNSRMLIPIVPVSCLMTGFLLHYAGLDRLPWRRLTAPRVAVPAALAVAALTLVVVPYRMGRVEAGELLPTALLERFGWTPDLFLTGTLLPGAALLLAAGLALAAGSRRSRLAALLVAVVAVFGLGFEFNRTGLAKRWAAQRGALLLYPWRVFEDDLAEARPRRVALSPDLQHRYGMSGVARWAIGRLCLGREKVSILMTRDPDPQADVAILSRNAYQHWARVAPELTRGARFDPGGLLVLLRPRAALASGAEPDTVADASG